MSSLGYSVLNTVNKVMIEQVLRYTSLILDRVVDVALLSCGCYLVMERKLTIGQVNSARILLLFATDASPI